MRVTCGSPLSPMGRYLDGLAEIEGAEASQ